jgi:hypothetical protein
MPAISIVANFALWQRSRRAERLLWVGMFIAVATAGLPRFPTVVVLWGVFTYGESD